MIVWREQDLTPDAERAALRAADGLRMLAEAARRQAWLESETWPTWTRRKAAEVGKFCWGGSTPSHRRDRSGGMQGLA